MISPSFVRRFAAATFASLALMSAGSAHAIFRAYLSSAGNDANPCTLPQPCRLLPAALAVVDAGGEIWMLDSANYNGSVVAITKSVTILSITGELGSLVGNNATALAINGAGIEVTLQNLNILRLGTGDIGVLVLNAAKVNIVNCNIFGFNLPGGLGIWVTPGANSPRVNVVNSVVRDNYHGMIVAGNGRATISRSHFLGNATSGVAVNSGTGIAVVHVNDSVSSGNGGHGFYVTGSSGAFNSTMFVTRSVASGNTGSGFHVDGGLTAFLVVDNSVADANAIGFNNASGTSLTFQSRGNNSVAGNTSADTAGTISPRSGF